MVALTSEMAELTLKSSWRGGNRESLAVVEKG